MEEQYQALTDRILLLAYRLAHYYFTPQAQLSRWRVEMDELLVLRSRIPRQ